jgi:hypothetical protein
MARASYRMLVACVAGIITLRNLCMVIARHVKAFYAEGHTITGNAEVIPGDPMALLLPACRLLAAKVLIHISRRPVSQMRYSFPVGFWFQEERALLPAKILEVKRGRKVE